MIFQVLPSLPLLTAHNVDPGQRTAYNSLIRVDDNTVALAYSWIGVGGNKGDGDGRIRVFDVDSAGAFTETSSQTYYGFAETATSEERIHLNSLALADSDTLAVAYRGAEGYGFIRLYDINPSGVLSANGEPFEHDAANGAFNSLVQIDDNMLALVYGGDLETGATHTSTVPNTIKTFDTEAPTIDSVVATDKNTIVITVSEPVTGVTTKEMFTVNGVNPAIDPEIVGRTITLTVSMSIVGGETVTVVYSGSTITDFANKELVVFTYLATNNVQSASTIAESDTPAISDATSLNISITHTDTPVISDESDIPITNASGDNTLALSQIAFVDLENNGYRHNLIHLTGDYYVSSQTVTVSPNTNTWHHYTVIRLYSITDGQISLLGSETVDTTDENKGVRTVDIHSNPRATSITAVDNNTIAVSYVEGILGIHGAVIATYDVDTSSTSSSTSPFGNKKTLVYNPRPLGGQISSQSLTTLDTDTLILAYSHPNSGPSGFIRAINIAPDGTPTAGAPVTITSNQGRYPSIVTLDDNTVVVAYRDQRAVGHIRTYDVSSDSPPSLLKELHVYMMISEQRMHLLSK